MASDSVSMKLPSEEKEPRLMNGGGASAPPGVTWIRHVPGNACWSATRSCKLPRSAGLTRFAAVTAAIRAAPGFPVGVVVLGIGTQPDFLAGDGANPMAAAGPRNKVPGRTEEARPELEQAVKLASNTQ